MFVLESAHGRRMTMRMHEPECRANCCRCRSFSYALSNLSFGASSSVLNEYKLPWTVTVGSTTLTELYLNKFKWF